MLRACVSVRPASVCVIHNNIIICALVVGMLGEDGGQWGSGAGDLRPVGSAAWVVRFRGDTRTIIICLMRCNNSFSPAWRIGGLTRPESMHNVRFQVG